MEMVNEVGAHKLFSSLDFDLSSLTFFDLVTSPHDGTLFILFFLFLLSLSLSSLQSTLPILFSLSSLSSLLSPLSQINFFKKEYLDH